jgi:hypothetical protein
MRLDDAPEPTATHRKRTPQAHSRSKPGLTVCAPPPPAAMRPTSSTAPGLSRAVEATRRQPADERTTAMHDILKKCGLRLLCVCLVASGAARAQDLTPPSNTFELSLGAGYGQGFGPVAADVPTLQGFGKAGGTLVLNAGWRIDPRWEAGIYGEFGYFSSGVLAGSDHALTAAAGLQGQFHLLPAEQWDPWVGVGFGWRGYWGRLNGNDYVLQGLDLARLQVGVDYRLTRQFSVGPVAGITLTEFLSHKPIGANGYSDTHDRKVDTFVFAGLGGRFDL